MAPFSYNRQPSLMRPAPWYFHLALRGRRARTRIGARAAIALAAVAVLVAGCGSNAKQDANEPSGSFPMSVEKATFPSNQKLAKSSRMEIDVRNAGQKTVPNVSVTVKCPGGAGNEEGGGGGFTYNTTEKGVADPARPQFVVDKIPTRTARPTGPLRLDPLERSSAFVDTYPLGKLAPGGTVRFTWDVTAVHGGPYHICWQVNAGLYGKAKAVAAASSTLPLHGSFSGNVSSKAPLAEVRPDGTVVEVPSVQPSK
jgi:hypothetical protein